MHELTNLIKEDMKPALGVTEPGAIAFSVASAKELVEGEVKLVSLRLNSGMYKNAFTCGIPGTIEVGNEHAAALGVIAADASKGLTCLEGVTKEQHEEAKQLVLDGKISVEMSEVTSRIFIEATVETENEKAIVTIRDAHTNIVKKEKNGEILWEKEAKELESDGEESETILIHRYTLSQMVDYIKSVPLEEIQFIEDAYEVNLALFEEGLSNERAVYAKYLFEQNGKERISKDEQKSASLLCNAAIEARVIGLDKPAMSITGSGAHGIIATLPLCASCSVNGYSKEKLLRATALSYLICTYIKEYSGKLSAFCGCAIAAGTGMACGLVYLKGGDLPEMEHTIRNMASSITGMICDGGNHGCTMKGIVAVDAAYRSVELAMKGISIASVHGINGKTPEDTMRFMGEIASPGMTKTEKTIVDILQEKMQG